MAPNTTGDIYYAGNSPPAAADVSGVAFHLTAAFQRGSEGSEGDQDFRWTHLGGFKASVDIRDNWPSAANSSIYVPDKNGTQFLIVFVELVNRGTAAEHKRVYLERQSVSWPSDEL